MRARIKRRQRIRRVTIVATVALIAVSLAIGLYLVINLRSSIDSYVDQPVSTTDVNSLYLNSVMPYGPAPSTAMLSNDVKSASGQPFTTGGKPIFVYIGADYCPNCAIERWSMILALMRFGNFSNLHYMVSAPTDGDIATFTFQGATYQSKYLVFEPFEHEARAQGTIQTPVPANYTAEWQQFGSGYPFMNFGNSRIVAGATMNFGIISGRNWTQILSDIKGGDNVGYQIKQSANLITSLICKITGNIPASVCSASPISSTVSGIAAPAGESIDNIVTPSVGRDPA